MNLISLKVFISLCIFSSQHPNKTLALKEKIDHEYIAETQPNRYVIIFRAGYLRRIFGSMYLDRVERINHKVNELMRKCYPDDKYSAICISEHMINSEPHIDFIIYDKDDDATACFRVHCTKTIDYQKVLMCLRLFYQLNTYKIDDINRAIRSEIPNIDQQVDAILSDRTLAQEHDIHDVYQQYEKGFQKLDLQYQIVSDDSFKDYIKRFNDQKSAKWSGALREVHRFDDKEMDKLYKLMHHLQSGDIQKNDLSLYEVIKQFITKYIFSIR